MKRLLLIVVGIVFAIALGAVGYSGASQIWPQVAYTEEVPNKEKFEADVMAGDKLAPAPNEWTIEQKLPAPAPMLDISSSKQAISIERDGEKMVSITIYDYLGERVAVIHPDGKVEVLKGTPGEAAAYFWKALSQYIQSCNGDSHS